MSNLPRHKVTLATSTGVIERHHFFGKPFLDFMEFLCSNILIPLGGLLAVITVGYIWGTKGAIEEITVSEEGFLRRQKWIPACFKVVAPLFIILVFLHALGLFG